MNKLFNSKEAKILTVYYIFIFLWWLIFYLLGIKNTFASFLYQGAFAFISLGGGIFGLQKARKWSGWKSQVGKSLTLISIGLISWGIGQLIWTYYNIFLKVNIPYPSFADVGYITAVPFWAIGTSWLSKATGATLSLKKIRGKILIFMIPLVIGILSYKLLFLTARGGVLDTTHGMLKLFFDLAYPFGDLIILTTALLIYGLSFTFLGGRFKIPVITILLGFVCMYIADFSFSYTTTINTYYNGHWVDMLFPTAQFMIAFGVCNFDKKPQEITNNVENKDKTQS